MEGGLVEFWKYWTWVRIKQDSRKEMTPIEIKEIVSYIEQFNENPTFLRFFFSFFSPRKRPVLLHLTTCRACSTSTFSCSDAPSSSFLESGWQTCARGEKGRRGRKQTCRLEPCTTPSSTGRTGVSGNTEQAMAITFSESSAFSTTTSHVLVLTMLAH